MVDGDNSRKKKRKNKMGFRFKRPGGKSKDKASGVASVSTNGEPSSVFAPGRKGKNSKDNSSKSSKDNGSPKRRGLGARIKGIVKGRTKRKKGSGDADNSLYTADYDPGNPPKQHTEKFNQRHTGLDPNILAQVVEDDSLNSDSDHHDRQNRVGSNRMMSKKVRDLPHDMDTDDDLSYEGGNNSQDHLDGIPGEAAELNGPISLVLLLVDPQTLRFELLQLEFDTPQEATVNDVLEQISNSVTEPAIQKLQFIALVDRLGEAHDRQSPLKHAVTKRKGNKDILVGLSKDVTMEQCSRLARPILGDEKVIGMLEISGYNLRGWAKDKSKESIVDEKSQTTNKGGARKQMLVAGVAGGTLVVLILVWLVFQRLFGGVSTTTMLLENSTATMKESIINNMVMEGPAAVVDAVTDDFVITED